MFGHKGQSWVHLWGQHTEIRSILSNISYILSMINDMIYLSKVGVCQCLLCSDPLVGVNLQHLLQEVDGHRVGALKHSVEILLLHFWK